MDALRELARFNFQSHRNFRGLPPGADGEDKILTIRILNYPTREPKFDEYLVPEGDLPLLLDHDDALQAEDGGEQANARLNVVVVPRDDNEMIRMSREKFLQLWDSFNIDPYALGYISENWYGFYSSTSTCNGAYTFFIGTILYVFVFSFNPRTTTTSAILLPRDTNGFGNGLLATKEFLSILHQYRGRVHTPVTSILVGLIHLEQWLDRTIYLQLETIREAEHKSGYGPYGEGSKRVNIDTLTQLSSDMGKLLVTLANTVRHQDIAVCLADFLDASLEPGAPTYGVPEDLRGTCDQSEAGYGCLLATLKQQLKGGTLTTRYLQERTKSQSDVLFALVTHEDALISIDQNSSMKTIAVVTMAFLPGTFFATLFAVPSLQWDKSPVAQGNFWVYWVFALPFTALVLLMWYCFTYNWPWRQEIRRIRANFMLKMPGPRQKSQGQV